MVVGPALAAAMSSLNLSSDIPWNFAAETPVLAQGNANLEVEKVTGWEFGYKGSFSGRSYLSFDLYFNRLSNFVTDLLPGVNPAFPLFDVTDGPTVLQDLATIDQILAGAGLPADHPLRAGNAQLVAGYNQAVAGIQGATGPALTTVGGLPAIVVSYANAGKVDEYGMEVGFGYGFTPELRFDAAYTLFKFDVKEQQFGEDLVPNTAQHKFNTALTFTGTQGFDASVNFRFVEGYDWAAGVFAGSIPSQQTLDVSVGYRVNNNFRLFTNASNLLDQKRFQLYGGSVIGRRVLGGITATF